MQRNTPLRCFLGVLLLKGQSAAPLGNWTGGNGGNREAAAESRGGMSWQRSLNPA